MSRSGTAPTSERIRSAWPARTCPKGQRHHHRQGQPDTGLHLGEPADVVGLEVEAVVEAAVDPFYRRASVGSRAARTGCPNASA